PGQQATSRPGGEQWSNKKARKLGSPRSSQLSAAGMVASSGVFFTMQVRPWRQSSRNANFRSVEHDGANNCLGRSQVHFESMSYGEEAAHGPAERDWPPIVSEQFQTREL